MRCYYDLRKRRSDLLNGTPGPWIQCQRGLRQGDPLSPFLFIIVADVLQRLLLAASANGQISHPIDETLPCLVLQYADDTLIILRADHSQLVHLKDVLSNFSLATGLQINFHKSTFMPIHVDAQDASSMAGIFVLRK